MKKPASEILTLGTFKRDSAQLRRALSEIGREYKCEKCSLKEWCGELLTIEIHHKDGNPLNNISTNLQFLCPNCHSLTPNFYNTKKQTFCDCGRPKTKKSKQCRKCGSCHKGKEHLSNRKVVRPNKKELEILVWQKSTVQIAKDFNVSDVAISKWCKFYNISKPPRGYWAKIKNNNGR